MKKPSKAEIFKNGTSLADYPIDENTDNETESNGSTQHIIEYNGKYYFLQVGWDEKLGRLTELDKEEELEDGGLIADLITEYEQKS